LTLTTPTGSWPPPTSQPLAAPHQHRRATWRTTSLRVTSICTGAATRALRARSCPSAPPKARG